jgi:hypothetical protein
LKHTESAVNANNNATTKESVINEREDNDVDDEDDDVDEWTNEDFDAWMKSIDEKTNPVEEKTSNDDSIGTQVTGSIAIVNKLVDNIVNMDIDRQVFSSQQVMDVDEGHDVQHEDCI